MITAILGPFIAGFLIAIIRKKGSWLALAGALVSLVAGISLLLSIENGVRQITIPGLPDMPFILKADPLNIVLLQVVNVVAFFIFIYAIGYMKEEKGKTWFWSGMSLFLAAMELLVLSGDWISFITGWELMGLASYLLIATWHWRQDSREGATKAFMLTRVTDMGLYLGAFSVILMSGSSAIEGSASVSLFGAFMFLIAVMGKSAQIPFQSWLSGAMAGPTPVSALLHSATMVAAGIVLMLKIFPMLPESSMIWIGSVGAATIILAGTTALFSSDIKQMLAASTSSQLGFMLLAIGAGSAGAAAAHLVAHAFMKSSLFLGAGIFQHGYEATEFEKIKGGGRKMKATLAGFAIAAIGLSGIPPMIGYWSKDAVLAAGLHGQVSGWYFPAAVAGALLTALYMGRALSILWNGEKHNPPASYPVMTIGLGLLVLAVLAGGFFLEPVVKFMDLEMPKSEVAKYAGLGAAIIGLGFGWTIRKPVFKGSAASFVKNHYVLLGGYQNIFVKPAFKLASASAVIEKGLFRLVNAVGNLFIAVSAFLRSGDAGIMKFTEWIGKLNVNFSGLIRLFDEKGVDGVIFGLVDSVKKLGAGGQTLQSGLVHKELMWSAIGLIGFLIALFIL